MITRRQTNAQTAGDSSPSLEPDSPACDELNIEEGSDQEPAAKMPSINTDSSEEEESESDEEESPVKKPRGRHPKEKGSKSGRERSLSTARSSKSKSSTGALRKKKSIKSFNIYDNLQPFRDLYRAPSALSSPPSMEEMEYPSKVTNGDKYQHVLELTIEADEWMEQAYKSYQADLAEVQEAYKDAVGVIYALEDRQADFVQYCQSMDGKSGKLELELKKKDAEIKGLKADVAAGKKVIKVLEDYKKSQSKAISALKSKESKLNELDFLQEKSNISVNASRKRKEDALEVKEKADQATQKKKTDKLQKAKQQFSQTRAAGGAATGSMADFVRVCLLFILHSLTNLTNKHSLLFVFCRTLQLLLDQVIVVMRGVIMLVQLRTTLLIGVMVTKDTMVMLLVMAPLLIMVSADFLLPIGLVFLPLLLRIPSKRSKKECLRTPDMSSPRTWTLSDLHAMLLHQFVRIILPTIMISADSLMTWVILL